MIEQQADLQGHRVDGIGLAEGVRRGRARPMSLGERWVRGRRRTRNRCSGRRGALPAPRRRRVLSQGGPLRRRSRHPGHGGSRTAQSRRRYGPMPSGVRERAPAPLGGSTRGLSSTRAAGMARRPREAGAVKTPPQPASGLGDVPERLLRCGYVFQLASSASEAIASSIRSGAVARYEDALRPNPAPLRQGSETVTSSRRAPALPARGAGRKTTPVVVNSTLRYTKMLDAAAPAGECWYTKVVRREDTAP